MQSEIERQKIIEKTLSELATIIDLALQIKTGDNMGFGLVVFDFGRPGVGHYVSNAKREDMVLSLRETADRLERREDIPPATTIV